MSDTITTLLTGRGRGAVATVAIEGSQAAKLVLKHFESATSNRADLQLNRIYFGTWRWEDYHEELVICRTGEQRFEIHCHGGQMAAQNIVRSLTDSGAQSIEPNEWTAQSRLNRFEAEALNLLPLAKTDRAVSILLDQARGAMPLALAEVQKQLELEPVAAIHQIETILSFANVGTNLTRPFSVTLIGPPNAGKSSLVNAIVGFERAIVYDQPGTTRDVVSAETALDGWPVSLLDTAGIRDSDDRIEKVGIEKAKQESAVADLVLLIEDVSDGSKATIDVVIPENTKRLLVGTKSDLLSNVDSAIHSHLNVITSSTTGQGIELLCEQITRKLVPDVPFTGAAVPVSKWQVEQLENLLALLRKQSLEAASRFLSELID